MLRYIVHGRIKTVAQLFAVSFTWTNKEWFFEVGRRQDVPFDDGDANEEIDAQVALTRTTANVEREIRPTVLVHGASAAGKRRE